MPLVVPGLMGSSSSSNSADDWSSKLLGKKLGGTSDGTTFAKQELPKSARVIEHGGMMTMDHQPDRMNVHLGQDGTVHKVTKG